MIDDELKDFEPVGASISSLMEKFTVIAENISILRPMIAVELEEMPDDTFWKSVCHAVISDTLEVVPDGTHLFQCPWSNREVFDAINHPRHYMIDKDAATPERVHEDKAQVWVNIAHMARFSMDCPYAGSIRCHLTNYQFETTDEHQRRHEEI